MKMSKYAGTSFLKVENFPDGPQIKTIEAIEEGQYGKPVVTFDDGTKLTLNATNTKTLIKLFGTDEHREWLGRVTELYVGKLKYQGDENDAVLVRLPSPPQRKPSDDLNDEVDF